MTYSYRVYPVVSVDIIVCFIVFSEVVVSACVVLSVVLLVTLVLTMCWCIDLYVCNKYNDILFVIFLISTKRYLLLLLLTVASLSFSVRRNVRIALPT